MLMQLSDTKSRLLPILQAPDGSGVDFRDGRVFGSTGGSWPIVDGAPDFLNLGIEARSAHISHPLPTEVEDMISRTEGLVLNLSAGGTIEKNDNVIEMEWGLFKNTDVSADAHSIPFKDSVFEGVVCLNAFEHYRDPKQVVREIRRVLKPGGFIYVITAFMQPFHMEPHHYFNVTPSGLREWFSDFEIEFCGSTKYHNAVIALQWLSASTLWALERSGERPDIQNITLGELRDAWMGNPSDRVTKAHFDMGEIEQYIRDATAQAVCVIAKNKK